MVIDFLHQKPARTVGNSFTPFVPGNDTQELEMTNLHLRSGKSILVIAAVDHLHQEPSIIVGDFFRAYVP